MISTIGKSIVQIFQSTGRAQLFIYQVFSGQGKQGNLTKQLFYVGVLSLPIIIVSGFFVGMVLGLQGYYNLVKFGAADSVGVLVALSLTRELGPVVGAILFAGRSGSALTTEIGLMKTTEQLSALELMGIDPMNYIIKPRLFAGLITLPMLVVLFIAVGVLGAWLICVGLLGVDDGSFWSQMQGNVSWSNDVLNGIIKSVVFAIIVSWLALFFGYDAVPSAEGVSKATTATVVYGSLWILGLDFIMTLVMF